MICLKRYKFVRTENDLEDQELTEGSFLNGGDEKKIDI